MASMTNGAPAPAGTSEAATGDTSTNKNGETKATAATYGALDTSQASNEVWMVKIPQKLATAWQAAPEGTVLGDLVFTKGSSNKHPAAEKSASAAAPKQNNSKPVKPSLTVHVSEELLSEKQSSDLSLTYSMEAMTKRVPVLHPFTRRPDGSVALHGTVSRTANLQVQRTDGRYRQLLKNRLLQTNVNSNRFVKPVEATELSVRKQASSALTNTAGFGSAVQQFGQHLAEANEGGGGDNPRKRKYEGQTTRSVVFELFSQQPFWTFKEIVRNSGRPEKEIRPVLSEIGFFHRSGEHKQQWELRKEYQSKKDGS